MASKSNVNVPEAKEALNNMKYAIAGEPGINLSLSDTATPETHPPSYTLAHLDALPI